MYLPCVQNFKSIGALSEKIFKKEEDRIQHWQKNIQFKFGANVIYPSEYDGNVKS